MKICPKCGEKYSGSLCGHCMRYYGPPLDPTKGRISITRADLFVGVLRKLKLFMDGSHMADLSTLKDYEFDVYPGFHEFYVKMDFSESPPLKICVNAGDVIFLGVKARDNNALQTAFYTFIKPKELYILEKLPIWINRD